MCAESDAGLAIVDEQRDLCYWLCQPVASCRKGVTGLARVDPW